MKRKLLLKLIISIALIVVAFSVVKAYGYTETVYSSNYPTTSRSTSSTNDDEFMPVFAAIGMELFVSIHMTAFVIVPLSAILAGKNYKHLAIIFSIIRAAILLYSDFFISTKIALVDFFAVFIGAFIVVPICAVAKGILTTRTSEEHFGMNYVNKNKKEYQESKKQNEAVDKIENYDKPQKYGMYDMDEEAFEEEDEDDPIKNL